MNNLQPEGKITNCYVLSEAPSSGIVVDARRLLPIPLIPCGMEAVMGDCTQDRDEENGDRYVIDAERIVFSNPAWSSAEKRGMKKVLSHMPTRKRGDDSDDDDDDVEFEHQFVDMVIMGEGRHSLNMEPASEDHFATVLVIHPSQRRCATITATHGRRKSEHRLEDNPRANSSNRLQALGSRTLDPVKPTFAPYFVALYTGLNSVTIDTTDSLCILRYHIFPGQNTSIPALSNIVGPHKALATAFAAWAYCIANNLSPPGTPERCLIYHLSEAYTGDTRASFMTNRKDEAILGHFGPLAKYYGFSLVFAHVDIRRKSQWAQYRELRKYDVQYRVGDWRMGVHGPVETETAWVLAGVDGKPIHDDPLIAYLDEQVRGNGWFLNNHLHLEDDTGRKLEVIDQGLYSDTLKLTSRKRASFLIVSPPPVEVPIALN